MQLTAGSNAGKAKVAESKFKVQNAQDSDLAMAAKRSNSDSIQRKLGDRYVNHRDLYSFPYPFRTAIVKEGPMEPFQGKSNGKLAQSLNGHRIIIMTFRRDTQKYI